MLSISRLLSASTIIVLLHCLAATNVAEAASFDCRKATTSTEKLICADPLLSELDEILAKEYRLAMKRTSDSPTVKTSQRLWLTSARAQCAEPDCLKQAYSERITALMSINELDGVDGSQVRLAPNSSTDKIVEPTYATTLPPAQQTITPEPKPARSDKSMLWIFAVVLVVLAGALTPKSDRRYKTGYKNNRTVPRIVPWLYLLSVLVGGFAVFT